MILRFISSSTRKMKGIWLKMLAVAVELAELELGSELVLVAVSYERC
jgi:hypothetical protein